MIPIVDRENSSGRHIINTLRRFFSSSNRPMMTGEVLLIPLLTLEAGNSGFTSDADLDNPRYRCWSTS